MKKILVILMAFFINIMAINACIKSVSTGVIDRRVLGHQDQWFTHNVNYVTDGSTPNLANCVTVTSGNTSIVVFRFVNGKIEFQPQKIGRTNMNINIAASCMCNGVALDFSRSVTLDEWGLSDLKLSAGTLTPAFDDMKKDYSASVPASVSKINITAEPQVKTNTVSGTGEYNLDYGENEIKINVRTQYGRTDIFTIKITREKPIDVESISFKQTELTASLGETISLVPIILPANASQNTLNWTSSNKAVATVDNNGKVKIIKDGKVTISVETTNGKKASVNITSVTENLPIPVTGVKFNNKQHELFLGETKMLYYTISPSDADNKKVKFQVNNRGVLSIDDSGKITAKNYGNAVVLITTEDGEFDDFCSISVVERKIKKITINANIIELDKGKTKAIPFTIEPMNVENSTLIWKSSDPTIVTVNQQGQVTGIKPGYAYITVSTLDSRIQTNINVEVKEESSESSLLWVILTISVLGILGYLGYLGFKIMKEKNDY